MAMVRKAALGVGALGVVVLSVVLSPLYQRLFGRERLRFPYLSHPIADAAYAALAAKPGWSAAKLEVAKGIELNGLIRRPSSKTSPWVLFYPGNDESQLDRGQAFLIRLAGATDWGLAVFAYRGYDSSAGKSGLSDLRTDAPEILARLCATEAVPAGRVHLVGFSIGGHFAVHAAGGAARRGQRAASLTLLASVNDIVLYHPSPWEKLSGGEDYQTEPFLAAVPAPVLVIQGAGDRTFHGPAQGRSIAAALGARAKYVELDGVDHVPLLADEHALELVRAFVTEHSQ
jgi:pimeloyl-ACP methyl ester carboxylesterase